MEKLSRYVPHIALLAIVLLLWMFVYSNSRLNEAIEHLDAAEIKMREALGILSASRAVIDSVQKDMGLLGTYVRDIQGRVEIMDLAQRAADDQFRNQRSRIKGRLKELYKEVESTGEGLPDIPVVEMRNNVP